MRGGAFEDALSRLVDAEEFTARHRLTGYDGAHRFARGWIALEKGHYSEAGALLSVRNGDDTVWPALGALLWGEPHQAISMLEGFDFEADPGGPVQQIEVELAPHLIASHAYQAVADRDRAEAEALREVSLRRAYGPRFRLAQALRRQASFTTARRAVPLLEEAVELAESTSRRPVQVRTLAAALGSALRRVGDERAAREMLYRAVDGATEIGMERVQELARHELSRVGGRPVLDAAYRPGFADQRTAGGRAPALRAD